MTSVDILIWIFAAASIVTFVSYQSIPNSLDGAGKDADLLAAIKGSLFSLFVRMCGIDHAVMAVAMLGMNRGWFVDQMAAVWAFITASSIAVALISATSAFVIYRVTK